MMKNQNIILGGGILLTLLTIGLGWFFFLRPKKNLKTITNSEKSALTANGLKSADSIEDEVEEEENETEEIEETLVETEIKINEKKVEVSSSAAVLEDDNDDEDEDDENQAAALKQAYDDALRLAKKFLAGNQYAKAANKYSEAIELSEKIPSAGQDTITLYNNRSAMYEKCGELDKSLNDIMVVLTMDAQHLKARVRRGRIYEVQGLLRQSAVDYAIATLLERVKNLPPSCAEKIDEFVKKLAVGELDSTMEKIKSASIRDLPCKSHCRNFMDSFPSYHLWKQKFAHVDRSELVEAVKTNGGQFMENEQWADMTNLEHMTLETIPTRFETIYTLACYDLAKGLFKKGFDEVSRTFAVLRSAEIINEDGSNKSHHDVYLQLLNSNSNFRRMVASFEELHGTGLHLRADLEGAKKAYENSLSVLPLPEGFEVALKLASIYVEIGTQDESSKFYEKISDSINSPPQELANAWLNIHRVSQWISRDETGKFHPNALEKAKECVDNAIKLTADLDLEHDISARNCRMLAFIKRVHVLMQTKSQLGLQPDNDDIAQSKAAVDEAKKLSPKHETVMMLEVDFMSQEGNYDGAINQIEEIINLSEGDDAIPYVFKANTLAQKAMLHFQIAQQYNSQADAIQAQTLLQEVNDIYEKAIVLDPNGIEALIQSAQLKTMFGDLQSSMELSLRALPLARSRDEALEVLNIKIMTEVQLAAIAEIQKSNQVPS